MNKESLSELVNGIVPILQDNIVSIILYGSVSRGTDTNESDVDIALLVKNILTPEELDKLFDFIVDMNLKYDKVFSVIDINYNKFQKWVKIQPFYTNVKQEGIVLWEAT